MMGLATTEPFDDALATDEFFGDPYPAYDTLRASAPVYWSERFQAWIVTDYATVDSVIRDVGRFSNARRIPALLELLPDDVQDEIAPIKRHFSLGLVQSDPPDHDRIRTLVNRAFTPRTVEAMRPRIEAIVDETAGAGPCGWADGPGRRLRVPAPGHGHLRIRRDPTRGP